MSSTGSLQVGRLPPFEAFLTGKERILSAAVCGDLVLKSYAGMTYNKTAV